MVVGLTLQIQAFRVSYTSLPFHLIVMGDLLILFCLFGCLHFFFFFGVFSFPSYIPAPTPCHLRQASNASLVPSFIGIFFPLLKITSLYIEYLLIPYMYPEDQAPKWHIPFVRQPDGNSSRQSTPIHLKWWIQQPEDKFSRMELCILNI